MTASRSVLLGIVPVLIATPPSSDRRSTTATFLPILAACTAARCPAGPLPITTRSYDCIPPPADCGFHPAVRRRAPPPADPGPRRRRARGSAPRRQGSGDDS